MSWLSSATGIHLNSGRLTKPSLKSAAKLTGAALGSTLLPGVGTYATKLLGSIPGIGGALTKASSGVKALGASLLGGAGGNGGGNANNNPYPVGSPEWEAYEIANPPVMNANTSSSLWDNPLLLQALGFGGAQLLAGDSYSDARHAANLERDFIDMLMNEQKFQNETIQPLRAGAGEQLAAMMEPGAGTMISPGGRPRYQLPEYVPGQNVKLGNFRRRLPMPAGG